MRATACALLAITACGGRRPVEVPAPTESTPAVSAPDSSRREPARTPVPETAVDDPLAAEAAAVVDRQNAAYNEQDLEAFLATYAESVAVQRLGDTVAVTGKAKLRESTAAWFTEAPTARTDVIERMVLGPFVVDRQRVSGAPRSAPLDAIGIYEVRGGLIRRVWSIPPPPTTN